jgi:SpoVK/Ycf46/Vps4 family AAA+-type ATPase
VFVMGTGNDVTRLRPELLRRGRFDELFVVDLPDLDARRAILALHLAKRGRDPVKHRAGDRAAVPDIRGADQGLREWARGRARIAGRTRRSSICLGGWG